MTSLILANIFGFLYHYRKVVVAAVICLIAVFAAAIIFRSCNRPKEPKLNHDEIRAAQQAIADNDREKMLYILAQSEGREAEADKNIDEAEKAATEAITKAHREWSQKSNEEIAAELERRARNQ